MRHGSTGNTASYIIPISVYHNMNSSMYTRTIMHFNQHTNMNKTWLYM